MEKHPVQSFRSCPVGVKSESGVLYYTTSTFVCDHAHTTNMAAVAATCTQTGFTAGVYCNDCETYISGHEVVAALGHNWGAWVETTAPTCTAAGVETATCSRCGEKKTQSVAATGHSYTSVVTKPTETQQGYTTYTCSTCGHSYVGNYVEALGQTYTVSFSVPAGVTSIADMACGKSGITLPTAGTLDGYKFEGWTDAPVEDTESKPTILTGTYKATENTTLYAVYSYVESEGGQTSGAYTLHTGEITEGDYVIYYKTDAMVATMTDNGRISATNVTVSNNTINNPDATIVWHITPIGDGRYTIYNAAKNVYAGGTGTKNKAGLLTSVTDYAKWTVEGSSTYEFTNVGNKAKGVNALLRWNSTSIGWACYSSSTGGAVSLYKGFTGTTYNTTMTTQEPTVALTHISLDPSHDALGYKAAATNLPQGAHVEISLWVTENRVVTKSAETLRLKNILAYNGGQTEIFAKAQIVDAQGNVIAESAVVQTTMRQTLETVDTAWNTYSADQKDAVLALCTQYLSAVSDWNIPNIKNSL